MVRMMMLMGMMIIKDDDEGTEPVTSVLVDIPKLGVQIVQCWVVQSWYVHCWQEV